MSESSPERPTPFDVQRRSIDRSHRIVLQGIDAQRRFLRAYRRSLDAQRAAGETAAAAVTSALDAFVIAAFDATPGEETEVDRMEARFEEGLAAFEDARNEWGSLVLQSMRDGVDTYDEFVGSYGALFDASFEAMRDANEWFDATANRFGEPPADAVRVEISDE